MALRREPLQILVKNVAALLSLYRCCLIKGSSQRPLEGCIIRRPYSWQILGKSLLAGKAFA